ASRYTMKGEVAKQEGNFHPTSPGTGMFQTADGYINIAASGDNLWKRFCEVAGDKELSTNPDFATVPLRAKNRAALIAHLNDVVRSKPSAYWVEELNKAGVPCGPINTVEQGVAFAGEVGLDPVVTVGEGAAAIPSVRNPITFSDTPADYRLPPPALDEHGAEIRRWLAEPVRDPREESA
ncbi:MAG: CoA transferase, partial [Blastococcus sp.]